MELDKLERKLEILTKQNKEYFEKERSSKKIKKTFSDLDLNSAANRKREVFRQVCQIEHDLSSFEFFNKLVDYAMLLPPSDLKKILK